MTSRPARYSQPNRGHTGKVEGRRRDERCRVCGPGPAGKARVVEELGGEDRIAIGWALSTRSPAGRAVGERLQRGEREMRPDELMAIRRAWEEAGRPAYEPHVHRSAVELVDGTSLTAVSFLGGDPYRREAVPAFGLYLDARWDPPWPHEHVDWPDFGVPGDTDDLWTRLDGLLARARGGALVEIGCLGGHGRTGTALACLAVMTGTPPEEAVGWVRAAYCPD